MISLTLLSVGVFVSYTWISDVLSFSNTYATMHITYTSPLYYFTILVTIVFCSMIDLFMHSFNFNIYQSPSDFLRLVVDSKGKIVDYKNKFDSIYQKTRDFYRKRDQKREEE